jgi:hypothetical protein
MHRPARLPLLAALCLPAALCLLAASCSGPEEATETIPEAGYRYPAKAEMSAERVASAAEDFSVLRPSGWQETADPRNAPNIALWLVREDYAASLSFTPIQMDPALYATLRRDGVLAMAKASLSMKRDNARDSLTVLQAPERFLLGGRSFAAYEYSVDRGASAIRVVIFDSGRGFLECALLPATAGLPREEQRRFFELQQAVLASLVVK